MKTFKIVGPVLISLAFQLFNFQNLALAAGDKNENGENSDDIFLQVLHDNPGIVLGFVPLSGKVEVPTTIDGNLVRKTVRTMIRKYSLHPDNIKAEPSHSSGLSIAQRLAMMNSLTRAQSILLDLIKERNGEFTFEATNASENDRDPINSPWQQQTSSDFTSQEQDIWSIFEQNIKPGSVIPHSVEFYFRGTFFSTEDLPERLFIPLAVNDNSGTSESFAMLVVTKALMPVGKLIWLNKFGRITKVEEWIYKSRYHRGGSGTAYDVIAFSDGSYIFPGYATIYNILRPQGSRFTAMLALTKNPFIWYNRRDAFGRGLLSLFTESELRSSPLAKIFFPSLSLSNADLQNKLLATARRWTEESSEEPLAKLTVKFSRPLRCSKVF